MLVTDHPHLFEAGGENYHGDFGAWDYLRGHEDDPWRTRPDPSWIGAPALPGAGRRDPPQLRREPHVVPRGGRLPRSADDDRGRAVARSGARRAARRPRSASLLVVDEFDPHEPFDTPEPWASRYDPDWSGERLIWPPYARNARRIAAERTRGPASARAVRRQALDDRSLARPGHRRGRSSRRVGHHRVRRVHRSRPLPRRARRNVGQAASARVSRARSHPAADRVARRRAAHVRRAHDHGRSARDAVRRVRRDAASPHARPFAGAAARRHGDERARVGAVRRVGTRGARDRRDPHVREVAGRPRTVRCRCARTAGRRCRSARSRTGASRIPTTAPGSTVHRAATCR